VQRAARPSKVNLVAVRAYLMDEGSDMPERFTFANREGFGCESVAAKTLGIYVHLLRRRCADPVGERRYLDPPRE